MFREEREARLGRRQRYRYDAAGAQEAVERHAVEMYHHLRDRREVLKRAVESE